MDVARAASKIASARALGAIVTFLGLLYFTRVVPQEELGVFFLFQALVGLLAIPANLGTRLAVEKRVSEGREPERFLTAGILLKLALLASTTLGLLALRGPLAAYLGADLLWYVVAALGLREFGHLFVGCIRGELRVGQSAVLKLSYPVTWIGVGAGLASLGFGLHGLVYAVLLGHGVELVWALHRLQTSLAPPSLEHVRSLLSYGVYLIVPSIQGQVHNWMDLVLLGTFVGPAAVAAYEVAWRVGNVLLILIQSIGQTIFPKISALYADDDVAELERLVTHSMNPAFLLAIPATGGAWLLSTDLLAVLFGAEYTVAAAAFVVIVAGKVPRGIRVVLGKGLLGTDRERLATHAALVDVASNLVLNVVLITAFGLIGAALGTTLSLAIGCVVRWSFLSREIDVAFDWQTITWACLGTGVMVGVLYPIAERVPIHGVGALLGFVVAGVLVYATVLVANDRLRVQVASVVRSFA